MDMFEAETLVREGLRKLNTHTKRSALEAKLCRETLALCNSRDRDRVKDSTTDVIETLLMMAQLNGVSPRHLKDELLERCHTYLAKGTNNAFH